MVHLIPAPQPRETLLPLLACLPTAFLSPHPPPALLPLLSPILRQRIHLLSSTTSSQTQSSLSNGHGSQRQQATWLPLLSYPPHSRAALLDTVSKLNLEPHPVSGELELDATAPVYLRKDEETLLARCDVVELRLRVVWMWCRGDTGAVGFEALQGALNGGMGMSKEETTRLGGEARDKWLVAEVVPLDEEGAPVLDENVQTARTGQEEEWRVTIPAAEDAHNTYTLDGLQDESNRQARGTSDPQPQAASDTDDDDSDWAQYDATPGRTPSEKPSPAPNSRSAPSRSQQLAGLKPLTSLSARSEPTTQQQQQQGQSAPSETASEKDYFARYGEEVQPALDGHDPDEEEGARAVLGQMQEQAPAQYRDTDPSQKPRQDEAARGSIAAAAERAFGETATKRPAEPLFISTGQENEGEAKLGNGAEAPQLPKSPETIELGVKQHISSEIKSLFRLARSVGMERGEFERVVGRELDVLGMMEDGLGL